MTGTTYTLTLIAVLGTALAAGAFFAFSVVHHGRAAATVPDAVGAEAMNGINRKAVDAAVHDRCCSAPRWSARVAIVHAVDAWGDRRATLVLAGGVRLPRRRDRAHDGAQRPAQRRAPPGPQAPRRALERLPDRLDGLEPRAHRRVAGGLRGCFAAALAPDVRGRTSLCGRAAARAIMRPRPEKGRTRSPGPAPASGGDAVHAAMLLPDRTDAEYLEMEAMLMAFIDDVRSRGDGVRPARAAAPARVRARPLAARASRDRRGVRHRARRPHARQPPARRAPAADPRDQAHVPRRAARRAARRAPGAGRSTSRTCG